MSEQRTGPGRPNKGARTLRTFRVSRELNARIEADAAAQGLTMSDFLANIVCAHYGQPPAAEPQIVLYQREELALPQAS